MGTKKGDTVGAKGKPVKTTVELPPELWRAAKIRAVEDGTDLRGLIIRGLEWALAQKPRKA